MYKIDKRELKDTVNLFLFEALGAGIETMKAANDLCDVVADTINKTIDKENPQIN